MVAIGALLACMNVLTLADMETALNNHMPGRHKNLLPKNVEALSRGAEFARKVYEVGEIFANDKEPVSTRDGLLWFIIGRILFRESGMDTKRVLAGITLLLIFLVSLTGCRSPQAGSAPRSP